ncbi:MAG: DUF411 domain-containing protein [Sphingomonas sp.]|nr:DUF411 domain-containing protein [Sphingomonas sp.]
MVLKIETVSRRFVLLAPLALAACAAAPRPRVIEVVKTPTCDCCTGWIEHLRAAGFTANVTDVPNLHPVSQRLGVPEQLHSCHTASIGGYVVEGHVPAADIVRLLDERPDILGIAVPGMPIGSPGMEQGDRREPYQTIAFTRDGRLSVFASH